MLTIKSFVDSLHLSRDELIGLVAFTLAVAFTVKAFIFPAKENRHPPEKNPIAPRPESTERALSNSEDPIMHLSYLFLPNGTAVDELPAYLRDQHFREAFHLLMQYHILKADICRQNMRLGEGDEWLEHARAHEAIVVALKQSREKHTAMSGYVAVLLSAVNALARDLFEQHMAERLVQANNEALTRPKDEVREEIEQYWSLENQAAKARQVWG